MHRDKTNRILDLFMRFTRGECIRKSDFAKEHHVSGRSVERDIEDLRNFLAEIHSQSEILLDKEENKYYLSNWQKQGFTNIEAIALLKILLGSRVLRKDEMQSIVNAIRSMFDPKERKETWVALTNEIENYVSPIHNKPLLGILDSLNKAIYEKVKIDIDYIKANKERVQRKLSPIAIIFSDFYFYLIAFIERNPQKVLPPPFFQRSLGLIGLKR